MRQRQHATLPFLCALVLALAPARGAAAPPAEISRPSLDLSIYGHVVQVGWVVKDLDRVVDYWEKLGLKNIHRTGVREFPDVTFRGKKSPIRTKNAFGDIGGVQMEWIEPVEGKSVDNEFLAKHGDGVHHLAFFVQSPEQLEHEIQSFKSKGVDVVQFGSWQGTRGRGRFAYLDFTEKGGGLTVELMYNPDAPPSGTARKPENESPFTEIVQYAFLVRDVKQVAAYYQSLGFGGMAIDHNVSVNRNYRGDPGKFEMFLGWWRFGDVPFEWIQPLVGPSVYDEYLKARGEGFHHLAFRVSDMDQAVQLLKTKGAPVAQSGGWDNPQSKGRFAYLDTDPHGGVTIELLWNQPRTP